MITQKKLWTKDKQECIEYTMSNQQIEVKALNYGGVITGFSILGQDNNCVVAYKDKTMYQENPFYMGSHIGPVAGRIKNGQFTMDNETIQLEQNEGSNHLHGGTHRLDHIFFDTYYEDDDRFPSLVFIQTVDYDQTETGYKGKVKYIITLKLVQSTFMLNIKAFPTQKMPLRMVSHMYFNLCDGDSVLDHVMEVGANNIIELDQQMTPTGDLLPVVNTAFDFRTAYIIGERIKKGHSQFEYTRNIDHFFVLEEKKTTTLFCPDSGLALNVTTTGDGMVLYLANYFDEQFENEKGHKAKNQSAIAIEACHWPLNIGKDMFYDDSNPFDMTTTYVLKNTR